MSDQPIEQTQEQQPRKIMRLADNPHRFATNEQPIQKMHVAPSKPTPDQLYKYLVDSGWVAAYDQTPASVAAYRYKTEPPYAEAVDCISEHRAANGIGLTEGSK